jgi:MFS family permease
MEVIILGWYVLVETGSVLALTVFASLQHLGTLLAPLFGVVGDRIGHRTVLCAMRAAYALLATTLMTLAYLAVLTPMHVFIIAALMGLMRPSDIGMRAALVGETMPPDQLIGAMGIQRTTQDSARIAGALSGAGMVALLGMAPAYVVIAGLYATSFLLTLGVASGRAARRRHASAPAGMPLTSPWRELQAGLAYVWTTPYLLAAMCIAFLVNLTAFPLVNGLLPYVVKEIYGADQTVLGYLVAGFATGALLGSLAVSRIGRNLRPGRAMIVASVVWYLLLMVFAQLGGPVGGFLLLMLAGCAQSLAMVTMAALLLRHSDEQYRGRIMGIRMLAVYGLPVGLLISGPLVAGLGFPLTATLYCVTGLACTLWIALHWRAHLWVREAPSNLR